MDVAFSFFWHFVDQIPRRTLYGRNYGGKDWESEIKCNSLKEVVDWCQENVIKVYLMSFYLGTVANETLTHCSLCNLINKLKIVESLN